MGRVNQLVNVATFPGYVALRGSRHLLEIHNKSRELAYYYDMGRRLADACGLPKYLKVDGQPVLSSIVLGEGLYKGALAGGWTLKGASITGPPNEILALAKSVIPTGYCKDKLTVPALTALRIINSSQKGFSRSIEAAYDRFVPDLSLHSLDLLINQDKQSDRKAEQIKAEKDSLLAQYQQLLDKARDYIHYLNLGNQAYMEIMGEIYRGGKGLTLEENITDMLNVATKWAYQIIGRSPDSEAAGWLVIGPDGQLGMPYRFLVPGETLVDSEVIPLRQKNGRSALPPGETKIDVADKRGRYLAVAQWEEWSQNVREDLVVIEKNSGEKNLYRRVIRPGSDLVGQVVEGLAGEFAGGIAGSVVNLFGKKNALVRLEPVSLAEAGLKAGEIIPVVVEGTKIKLVSAGSANPNLRELKISKGTRLEELSARAGDTIGIVNQDLSRAVGNVQASAKFPLRLMIEDANAFCRRPQNEFLLKIVGVASYFLTSIFKYNELGEAVCLGCLEVTNPEIIPEKMTSEERFRLIQQFEAGQAFAELLSTGIMIKVMQEELNTLTRQYVGEKIFDLLRTRNFEALRGRVIDDATIVFSDVSGFTALSDKLKYHPEKVLKILSLLFARLDPILTLHQGIVDKHIGDCIMGDFGVPERKPGDFEEAVTAVVKLQLELQRLNQDPEIQKFYKINDIPPLGMSIGLHTGRVIAGNVGHIGSKIEYTVIGDAVNQAARLQHGVSRGQVLIGERTYDLLSIDYKNKMIADFNDYNRSLSGPEGRAYLKSLLEKQNVSASDELIDQILVQYRQLYQDAGEKELFVPCTIYAKNKGVLPGYFVRWDRHAYRWPFLRAALEKSGIRLEREPDFENQPLSAENVHQLWQGESDERQVELFESFLELKERQNAKLRKS